MRYILSAKFLSAVCLIFAVAAFVIHGKAYAPKPDAVNGTYYNRCCGNIVLRDGSLFYKGGRYPYDLESMKFGLTAYVRGSFTEEGARPSADDASLIFFGSKGQCGFETLVSGFERSFARVSSSNAKSSCAAIEKLSPEK